MHKSAYCLLLMYTVLTGLQLQSPIVMCIQKYSNDKACYLFLVNNIRRIYMEKFDYSSADISAESIFLLLNQDL